MHYVDCGAALVGISGSFGSCRDDHMLYFSMIIVCSRNSAHFVVQCKVIFRIKGNKTQNQYGLQINKTNLALLQVRAAVPGVCFMRTAWL
jgi:hypothetical protein